jgi:hypothetical protein
MTVTSAGVAGVVHFPCHKNGLFPLFGAEITAKSQKYNPKFIFKTQF